MFLSKPTPLALFISTVILSGCSSSDFVVPKQTLSDPAIKKSEGWELVWNDEFSGSEIDDSKWTLEENCWGGGNNEQQCYTARDKNAFVEGGVLYIVANKENFLGPNNVDGNYDDLKTLPYTSARLRSLDKGDWTYGRFEVRARMPVGQGTWPAIWMLPSDWVYGTWAASGEIDIVEAVNLKSKSDIHGDQKGQPETRTYGTLHYGGMWPNNKHSGQAYTVPDNKNPGDEFYTYSLEWEKDEMRWYVDDVHFATQTSDGWYNLYTKDGEKVIGVDDAPFEQRFHLLLNLAIGGSWAGNTNEKGIDSSVFPQALEVDYVRVYQCSSDPTTGKGCATVSEDAVHVKGNKPPITVELPSDYVTGNTISVFDGELSKYLQQNEYDPQGVIMDFAYVDTDDRGQVMQITKTGETGNVYFATPELDLTSWTKDAKLIFDIKMEEVTKGDKIVVKIDSGWPNVSDYSVEIPKDNQWNTITIGLNDLVQNGNSFGAGKVDMSKIKNLLVLDPQGEMIFQLDNVRFER